MSDERPTAYDNGYEDGSDWARSELTAANARIAKLEAIEVNLRAGLNAIVNCSGGAPRSALREAAAETLDGHTDSTMIDQSPFVARLKEMKDRIAELEAALKPFDAVFEDKAMWTDNDTYISKRLTFGDYRRARAALPAN